MTVRRTAIRFALVLAGAALTAAAYAHPGHGAPEGHLHGLLETLALVGAVAVAVWLMRGKR